MNDTTEVMEMHRGQPPTGGQVSEPPSATLPPTELSDDELREKMRAVREVATRKGFDKLFAPPVEIGTTTLLSDLHLVADAIPPEERVNTWEPTCLQCGTPLGYITATNYIAPGKTHCAACRGKGVEARLAASGISFREINQPLGALSNRDPDGKPYGDDYDRWLAFLRR